MCKYGTSVEVLCWRPAELTHDGVERLCPTMVDACIAPIVSALNLSGVRTRQSCCGHGKEPGRIDLWDGRVLVVWPSRKSLKDTTPLFTQEAE